MANRVVDHSDSTVGTYNTPMFLRRYIFNTLTVVSLLLLLATAGLWVDSDSMIRSLTYVLESQKTSVGVGSQYNGLFLRLDEWSYQSYSSKGWDASCSAIQTRGIGMMTHLGNFDYVWRKGMYHPVGNIEWSYLFVPHWFLGLIFATLPTIWLIKWRRRRNLPDIPCGNCGYDLTGNESGVCPECGHPMPPLSNDPLHDVSSSL